MDFSDLGNEAERRVWEAFPTGTPVDLGPGDPTADGFHPDIWDPHRTIRAEVLARLLLGACDPRRGYVAKVVLSGARIAGVLGLNGGEASYELILDRCWFDDPPDLGDAITKAVNLESCFVPGWNGFSWHCRGSAHFTSCRVTGQLNLSGAEIGGQLLLIGATLGNPDGPALTADNLTVSQDMLCHEGFTATGEIVLSGAKIGRQLSLVGATLGNGDGPALTADNLTVEQDMLCRDGFTATGEIALSGAKISGVLAFDGAKLANPSGAIVTAENLNVGLDMFCDEVTATGEIRMLGARIGGQLSLAGAALSNAHGPVINADHLIVDQGMFLHGGFAAAGEIRLNGAKIGGQLSFAGATLANPGDLVLAAESLVVGQDVFCHDGFSARGEVGLLGSKIGGILSFDGASIEAPGRLAMDCQAVTAAQVRLGADVVGDVDLTHSRIGVLHLPELRQQPPTRLAGLIYDDLDPDPDPPVRQRIAWLRRDPDGFHPQPYEQLAAYYRRIGHDREARAVLLAKRRDRRRAVPDTWRLPWLLSRVAAPFWRIPGWLVDLLAGYGYAPVRAFCWLVAAVVAGGLALRSAALPEPTADQGVNAFLVAVDAIVPTSPFGLRDAAALTGREFVVVMALQIVGYALSVAILPAVTRALSRTDR